MTSLDQCQDFASPVLRPLAACPMTCTAGFIATFKDPNNIWDSCNAAELRCVCAALPIF